MGLESDLKRELSSHIITKHLYSSIEDIKEIYKGDLSIVDFYGCLSDSLLTLLDSFFKKSLSQEERSTLLSESSNLITSYLESKDDIDILGLMYSPMITMKVIEEVVKGSILKNINKDCNTIPNEVPNEKNK